MSGTMSNGSVVELPHPDHDREELHEVRRSLRPALHPPQSRRGGEDAGG